MDCRSFHGVASFVARGQQLGLILFCVPVLKWTDVTDTSKRNFLSAIVNDFLID
jgi:hypothetical protein